MKSLKPYVVEETYEVLEAIDEAAPEKIKEELGDLLFQITLLARMAAEQGLFDIGDVMDSISRKMIGRHPHVYGEARAGSAGDMAARWQEHKKREGKGGLLAGIPASLPALMRAQKVQKRASRTGFDWQRAEDALTKIEEEAAERVEEELGDLLFSIVNLARFLGVQAEEALQKTTDKFIRRFGHIEKTAEEEGTEPSKMGLKRMDALWEEAKRLEKNLKTK